MKNQYTISLSKRLVILAGICLSLTCHLSVAGSPWNESFADRVEALALIQSLNSQILSSTSATLTLEKWCRDHNMAASPKVVATLVRGVAKPASPDIRHLLQVGDTERVNYRHVLLSCGDKVLSEADNWYVPARLTADMNQLLEKTDTPFGKAVLPLKPYRQTLAAYLLWSPLPNGWEMNPAIAKAQSHTADDMPDALFEHQAVLYTKDHQPFSVVNEFYQKHILDFPVPR